jgi:hypothetical protein
MQTLFALTPQTESLPNLVQALSLLERRLGDSGSHDDSSQHLLFVGTFQAKDWEPDRLVLFGEALASSSDSADGEKTATDSAVHSGDRHQILLNNTWLATASAAEIEALILESIGEAREARSSSNPDNIVDEEGRWTAPTSAFEGWDEAIEVTASDRQDDPGGENNATRSGFPANVLTLGSGSGGFAINGHRINDNSGWCVAGVGDVNGDGLGDVLIGAPKADPWFIRPDGGRSYVVFGKTGPASTMDVDLSAIANGNGGFVISGACSHDLSGTSVAAAGDVNGDGLADLLVGAPQSDPASGTNAGRSYVVFGKSDTTPVHLGAIAAGSGGVVINGQTGSEKTGFVVSSAGDINGDGLADLLIGAPYSDPATGVDAGRSYVIFGKSSYLNSIPPIPAIELSTLSASDGFAITGLTNTKLTGLSVAGAGDVNGDGYGDLIIGATNPDTLPMVEGYAYIAYGSPSLASVDLSLINSGIGGFRIKDRWNASIGTSLGFNVASAGDVNGDGLADVLVGNPNKDCAYVVFGKSNNTTPVELTTNPTWGFAIAGYSDQAGRSIASAGDVNGDGLADLLVGAPGADGGYGCSYVVFGKTNTATVTLDPWFFPDGIVINSQLPYDQSQTGRSVSSAGDVNGDGLTDLLIGAPFSDTATGVNAGRSYVIFGATNGAFANNFYDNIGNPTNDVIQGTLNNESFAGGLGNDKVVGMGGADIMNGGAGNDRFFLDPFGFTSSIPTASALMNPLGSLPQLARINGGTGIDTIVITSGGLTLNLNTIANQSAVNPNSSSRLTSIEVFDIRGSGPIGNSLILSTKEIDDITGFNWLNQTTAPTHNITTTPLDYYIPPVAGRRQLFIRGDANDSLHVLDGTWSNEGKIFQSGQAYNVFQSGTRELIVREGMITVGL